MVLFLRGADSSFWLLLWLWFVILLNHMIQRANLQRQTKYKKYL